MIICIFANAVIEIELGWLIGIREFELKVVFRVNAIAGDLELLNRD